MTRDYLLVLDLFLGSFGGGVDILPLQHGEHRLEQDFYIQHKAHIVHIVAIVLKFFFLGDGVAVVGLGIAGNAGANLQAFFVDLRKFLLGSNRQCGARTDKTHIADQHIEDLRQLVHRGLTHNAPNLGDTGIVVAIEGRSIRIFDVRSI